MRIKDIRSNLDLENEGVWKEYGVDLIPPGETPGRFKIARIGTPLYRAFIDRLQRDHARTIRAGGDDADKIIEYITRSALAEIVLVDWDNIHDDAGETLPYSTKEAYDLLSDPTCHDFYNWVLAVGTNAKNYRDFDAEETMGNSSASSTGTSVGDGTQEPSQPGHVAVG